MIDETFKAYTEADKDRNFALPFAKQDPFFGVTKIIERLMQRANEIRRPSRWLALDEEIVQLLGKCGASQYDKDKKNQRGPKAFCVCGSNFLGTNIEDILQASGIKKGYYHWIELYRGKSRDQPDPFTVYGKGFSVVCRAILDLNLRFRGYFLVCDSQYTSILLMVQMLYQGVNFLGTIKLTRKGLQKTGKDPQRPFADLKKMLGKDYDPEIGGRQGAQIPSNTKRKKQQGQKKGHFEIRKTKDISVVVNVQKDNKVMIEGGNSISMTKTAMVQRYNEEKRERESISVWLGHALYNIIYGQVDQATSWRTKAGGHKWKAKRWSKSMTHYAMFGILPTNAFLNMKMANPQDSRTFREFKKSVCRYDTCAQFPSERAQTQD